MINKVIIPTLNEQECLPDLFEALSRQTVPVDPIIIDGSSQDKTCEIAEKYGATVLHEEKPGKMRALQKGIKYILDEAQDDEIFFTIDADTKPVKHWAETHLREAQGINQKNSIQYGRVHHEYPWTFSGVALRTGRAAFVDYSEIVRKGRNLPPRAKGQNTCVVKPDTETLEELIQMPNYGLGEDVAIRDLLIQRGGAAKFLFNVRSTVVTSGDRYPSIGIALRRLLKPEEGQREAYQHDFGKRETYPGVEQS